MLNGFYSLRDPRSAVVRYVKITGNVVKEVTPKMVREFVVDWAIDTHQPLGLRDLILTTPLLSAATLEALKTIELDFTDYTESSQFFYFKNFSAEITENEIIRKDYRYSIAEHHVWESGVIQLSPKIFAGYVCDYVQWKSSGERELRYCGE